MKRNLLSILILLPLIMLHCFNIETLDEDNDRATSEQCSANDQPKKITHADGTTEEYTYNSNGDVLSYSYTNDGFNSSRTYTYDDTGKTLIYTYSDNLGLNSEYVYTYDDSGKLITENETSGSVGVSNTTYVYDNNGNLIEKRVEPAGGGTVTTTTYTHDENGNILTMGYTRGTEERTIACTYDQNGNVLTIDYSDTGGTSYTDTYTYNVHNHIVSYDSVTGSGVTSGYTRELTYNNNGDATLLVTTHDDGTIETYEYIYNSDGKMLSMEFNSNVQSRTFGFYNLREYTYDSCGNILTYSITVEAGLEHLETYTY